MGYRAPEMADNSHSSRGVIVLGPYRSGTSVTAKVLSVLGVNFGPVTELVPPSPKNPGGFYERRDINAANTALIESAGATLADPGDPRELAQRADFATLQSANMSWTHKRGLWGIKDPRMCATLLAWVESGVLDRNSFRIVHVLRSIEPTVRSGLDFKAIREYCDGTEAGIRAMTERYIELADWHVKNLDVPSLEMSYEALIAQPDEIVGQLARFIGVDDTRRIHKATRVIGKDRGMQTAKLRRYLIRIVRRLKRILSGGPIFNPRTPAAPPGD
jgi:hypothetical protein